MTSPKESASDRVLAWLREHATDGVARFDVLPWDRIVSETGIPRRTVYRAIAVLKSSGELSVATTTKVAVSVSTPEDEAELQRRAGKLQGEVAERVRSRLDAAVREGAS